MPPETHSELANFIWSICNLLRGPYKRNEYRMVVLTLTVLRRFDCLLTSTKERVLKQYPSIKGKPDTVVQRLLEKTTGYRFYNLSKLDLRKLLDDPNQLALYLLLSPEKDLRRSHVVKTSFDPARGTGGMLSVAEAYIRSLNAEADPHVYGQDWNDEAWAVCKSDMLIT